MTSARSPGGPASRSAPHARVAAQPRRPRRLSATARAGQGGYVLVIVLTALALIAFVALRLSSRVDELRAQAAHLQRYAQARTDALGALNAGVYFVTTRYTDAAGFGQPPLPDLRADGRPYSLPGGVELRVQDLRGLLPINALPRGPMSRLLQAQGLDPGQQDAWIDTLLDYADTDDLRRLNGAERAEYAELGLPPPRNDWLLSVNELYALPKWRDRPDTVAALLPMVSTNRDALLNPNTMPLALLQAYFPDAPPGALERFVMLRRQMPFGTAAAAAASTGLNFTRDDLLMHVSDRVRLTVWAPGLPAPIQYNLALVPDGADRPWTLLDAQAVPREKNTAPNAESPTPFPLRLDAGSR